MLKCLGFLILFCLIMVFAFPLLVTGFALAVTFLSLVWELGKLLIVPAIIIFVIVALCKNK